MLPDPGSVTITPAPAPSPGRDSLDRSALTSVAWVGAVKWSAQIISWGSTILVARILVPSDYGLLTMAATFMGVVAMLSEFGVGSAIVTLRELSDDTLGQLNSFAVILGLGGTALTVLMAYPLGLFFRAPELPLVLVAVGTTFTLNALQVVPLALYRRELNFRSIALIDLARLLITPVITLTGAMLGLRYWALALGTVIGTFITTVITLYRRPQAFARPTRAGLAPVMQFSRHILIGRLGWIVYQDGDFAVAGRRLGTAAAGVYGLAWTLASSPIEKITALLQEVTPSLFSKVQDDRPALKRYFLNLSEILCIATFPASVGLALVSSDLVDVVLGPKWHEAAAPLALLALYAGARSVTSLYGALFVATRETRFSMYTSVALAVALIIGFIVGSYWGPAGIAAAWLIIHPSFSVFSFTKVRKILTVTAAEYLKALRLGLDGAAAMAAGVLLFREYISLHWGPTLRLSAEIALGVAIFGAVTYLIHGKRLRDIIAWLRRVRG
jgi:O-antigen/teichoic acid export membrane protein